jgi:DNA-binding response OmpR family regulator
LLLLTQLLAAAGFAVRSFSDGGRGIESALAKSPAAMVVGLRSRGDCQLAFCRRLMESQLLRQVPVVCIGGPVPFERGRRGIEASCMSHIVRPFHGDEIVACVRAGIG